MKPTLKILIGNTLRGNEAEFLRRLCVDLSHADALILANFVVGGRQIDFVAITPKFAALIELKNLSRPIFGEMNGTWQIQDATGNRVDFSRTNPWQQTLSEALDLSDAMNAYRRSNDRVPPAPKRAYYNNFKSFVCIYPEIHRDSRVTPGDYKVAVRSYPDVLAAIRSGTIASSWTLRDWENFAEKHLHLATVSLAAAVDPSVLAAQHELSAYRQRFKTSVGADLAPLVEPAEHGISFLDRLQRPQNFLVFGPSGSSKTFYIRHLALAALAGDNEIPFLIDAKRYRGGDFLSLLRQSVAPYFSEDLKRLLAGIESTGLRPLLLIDAINECQEAHRADLLKGALAFALRYDARTIVTSQDERAPLAGLQVETIPFELPNAAQKRQIYAHYAGVSPSADLDQLCVGFTNAYDVSLAGRCHTTGGPPQVRADVYDRYVTTSLPARHGVTAAALLRYLANYMNDAVTFVINRKDCEVLAERFLRENGAKFDIIDAIFESRLVALTPDSFAFEHELLFEYFKADYLWRNSENVAELARELAKPRNGALLDNILPRYKDASEARLLLQSTDDVAVLRRVIDGACGAPAQAALRTECEQLITSAIADLANISVEAMVVRNEEGKLQGASFEITGARDWTPRENAISKLVAHALVDQSIQALFLRLLDATEETLHNAVSEEAKRAELNFKYAWSEIVRLYGGPILHSSTPLPCTLILAEIHSIATHSWVSDVEDPLIIRQALVERALGKEPGYLALLALLEDRKDLGSTKYVNENLDLVEAALHSGFVFMRMAALQAFPAMRQAVVEAGTSQNQRVRRILADQRSDNIWLNTLILEAQGLYDVIEPPVSVETAAAEMRRCIDPDAVNSTTVIEAAQLAGVAPTEWLARDAYDCLARIFEDVFQGVYYEAYSGLSDTEKVVLLTWAAQKLDRGFHTNWILQELLRYGSRQTLPVFATYANSINNNSPTLQDEVGSFGVAIRAYARWSDNPPAYTVDASPLDRAWAVIGEVLFWMYRDGGRDASVDRVSDVWKRLNDEDKVAAGVALYELHSARWHISAIDAANDHDASIVEYCPSQIHDVAVHCLQQREKIAAHFFRHNFDNRIITYLIETLAKIGGAHSLPVLRTLVDDQIFGHDALRAVESIQRRIAGLRTGSGA